MSARREPAAGPARRAGLLRVAVIGATGRMGRALVRAALERTDVVIAAALTHPGSAHLGHDAGELAGAGALGIPVASDPALLARCDVALDFSHSPAAAANLAACCAAGLPLLIGTTGLPAGFAADIERAARHIPLLVAANTSLGVTLLVELVRQAAQALARFDAEILEAHHRGKKDAPSGTALALGRAVAQARGQVLEEVMAVERAGVRREGDIGFGVVRGGDIVGEHTVIFAGTGEQLALSHRATDRQVFARGALQAVTWLADKPPGHYAMRDIIL
ncbi:MAG TPA: 4-hydroxy-tetrahydrodipicolinate reductase [Steroidobacteraceae bacterium]|nr:4-hydroxy-tetrahydrodipicolinate reductase [Steroidobacteraceae bacterium]